MLLLAVLNGSYFKMGFMFWIKRNFQVKCCGYRVNSGVIYDFYLAFTLNLDKGLTSAEGI